MAMRVGGARRKTRSIMSNSVREKSKISIRRYLQQLQLGDMVVLKAQPSVHEGIYFRRYHGQSGRIVSKQGECYLVQISAKGVVRKLLVHPAHLVKQ
jgi:large subunit ribosomal protein L21e